MAFIVSLLATLVSLLVYFSSKKMVSSHSRSGIQAIAVLIGLISIIVCFSRTLRIISVGNVGVVESFGSVAERPLSPGIHAVNPFSNLEVFSTRLRNVTEDIEVTSQEGLTFNLHVSLQYRLEPQQVVNFYQSIGDDEAEIIRSRFRSTVREITASYPVESVYSSQRQEVSEQLQVRLSEQLEPLGFSVEGAYLREVILPETLQAAIQEKLSAEQESQQMAFTLERERQEAERKRVEARGVADAQAIVAESLTDQALQLRAIEATESLAESDNAKVIIVGGEDGAPLVFQLNSDLAGQSSSQVSSAPN
ncbi:MAG: prohibitin family protein [Leptolyngbyaceae cyanobacterium RM2_2_4]|nr:prohibitin family protein [Leptolyngbyaceae cyanobacterium SM1_4_3]NJN58810.1 prohibitin family protein [Leptolyngbyaceae cyanobacterium SL_5_9]NJO52349.1 prohibitin family protein [Leptolyngbyaceae cyanobacterium RM2_2_4]